MEIKRIQREVSIIKTLHKQAFKKQKREFKQFKENTRMRWIRRKISQEFKKINLLY